MAETETKTTTRKKRGRPPKSDAPIDIETTEEVKPSTVVQPGDWVYLTVRGSANVKIGGVEITNRQENRCKQIPEDVSSGDLLRWDKAVRDQILTKGKLEFDDNGKIKNAKIVKSKPRLVKDESVKDWCIAQLDDMNMLRDTVIGLSIANVHLSGWHPRELLTEMRNYETHHRNRRVILDNIDNKIEACGNISFVNQVFDPDIHVKSVIHYDARIKE